MKTPVLEYLFNKVAGRQACEYLCEYCEIFKNTYFEQDLQTTVSKF